MPLQTRHPGQCRGLVGLRCDVVNPALDRDLTDRTRSEWLRSTALDPLKEAKTPDTAARRERTVRGLFALDRREKKPLDLEEHDGIDCLGYSARRHVIQIGGAAWRTAQAQAAAEKLAVSVNARRWTPCRYALPRSVARRPFQPPNR